MGKKILKIVFLSVLLTGNYAKAEVSCLVRQQLFRTGYLLNERQMSVLWNNYFLSRNKHKTVEEKISSVEKHIVAQWKAEELPILKAKELAQLIVGASESVGIDYQILAAIIQRESGYCRSRLNKSGGDSGCMQFTNPALKELKHQFGFAGTDKHSPGMPEILTGLAERYYKKVDVKRFEKYKKWIAMDINSIKNDLRNGSNFDFDILTGAIFLKFNLSLTGGNYGVAVRNYNGSQKKYEYQTSVMGNASKVALEYVAEDEFSCMANEAFEVEIMKKSCEYEDDASDCVQQYSASLPTST